MQTKKETPKQIKLSKNTARAMQRAGQHVNGLAAAARQAQALFEAAAATHQEHVTALVEDAGFKLEDFTQYGLWEDKESGDMFLRSNNEQKQQ